MIGCYDSLVNFFLLLLLYKLGFPTLVSNCLGSLWDKTTCHIWTQFGTSKASYHSTVEKPLYGPGQGSTCGPVFWILCWLVIYASLNPDIKSAAFHSACRNKSKNTVGVSFLDDTGLAVTSAYERDIGMTPGEDTTEVLQHLLQMFQALSQQWERLLYTTGSAINVQKCFWYVMNWQWKGGTARFAPCHKIQYSLNLTTGVAPFARKCLD
jgi:hypothetical protein